MKKIFVVLLSVILLVGLTVTASAVPANEVPSWLPGVVAYDFSNVTNADFTAQADETRGFFYSGGSQSEAAKITGTLVDVGSGKGVNLAFSEDVGPVNCHMDAAQLGAWPTGEKVYGFFFRVTTGEEGVDIQRFRMRYRIANGTVDGYDDLELTCYPGIGSTGTVRLFNADGEENFDDVADNGGYDAGVYLPGNFDGYIVVEYTSTVYLEHAEFGSSYGATDASCLTWPDYSVETFQFYCYMTGYEDSSVTFSDLGYLTDYISESSLPTPVPTEVPTATPTAAPTEAPTVTPTAAPTDEPTVAPTGVPTDAPTDTPTSAPTDAPTFAPTDAPNAQPSASLWLIIAAVVIVAAVVVVILLTKKKN